VTDKKSIKRKRCSLSVHIIQKSIKRNKNVLKNYYLSSNLKKKINQNYNKLSTARHYEILNLNRYLLNSFKLKNCSTKVLTSCDGELLAILDLEDWETWELESLLKLDRFGSFQAYVILNRVLSKELLFSEFNIKNHMGIKFKFTFLNN